MNGATNAFCWPLRVYYEDTDAQGVVYYANYFRFMERARTEWIRSLGIEQDRLLADQRLCFVVAGTSAEFRRSAAFNDMLIVTVRLAERARASFVLEQDIYRSDDRQGLGELLVTAVVRAACINADSGKPVRLPESLLEEMPT